MQLTPRNVVRGIVTLAAAIVLMPMVRGQSPEPVIGLRIDGLRTWLEFARQHTPGELDEALKQERRIEIERHFTLVHDFAALIQFIKDPGLNRLEKPGRRYSTEEQELLKRMAMKERVAGTVDSLLRKVALLESDGVMVAGGLRYVIVARGSGLPTDMVLELDGVSVQAATTPPNWQLARLAIGAMSSDPATRAWARQWYEATTAYFFFDRVLAALPKHLEQRVLAFPEDAGAWFDSGCHFEDLASDQFQQTVRDARRKFLRIVEHDRDDALRQARRMFEAAVERDPRHPEARVRLARVKLVQGDARSAAKELAAVLPDLADDPVLRYLGYLLLGTAQESSGEDEAARTAYREAATLYPRALSPRVALGRIEPPSVGSSGMDLEVLLHEDRRRADDPWLAYPSGPARRSRSLTAELWRVSSLR